MFWRAEKDNVTEPDLTVAYNGSVPRDLDLAGCVFFEAHAAIVALGPQGSGPSASADAPPATTLASLRRDRDRALRAVRRHPACDWSDIQTKMRVFFALEDWFGCEESIVAELSAEILREAALLLAADQPKMPAARLARQSSQPTRTAWFDRLPRISWLAQNQSPSEPLSVRRSQD